MPFTISQLLLHHNCKLAQEIISYCALAIGSMTPDLYRLFTVQSSMLTHQWKGLIYPNLALGLVFCAVWYVLYRPAVYRFFGIQHDLKLDSIKRLIFFIGVVFALIIGIATHIGMVLPTLTLERYLSRFLSQTVHFFGRPYPLHRLLQLGSSALALPFLGG